jgi:gamma-glutamylaminecyclotransferase
MPRLVFVFGTLKEGFPNFKTNRGQRLPGDFRTQEEFPLYLVGERCSPWLLNQPGQGHQVLGQVFEVSDQVLSDMDRLERITKPDGYRRIEIRVEDIDTREQLRVQAYLKNPTELERSAVQFGTLSEYTLEHASLYKPRAA